MNIWNKHNGLRKHFIDLLRLPSKFCDKRIRLWWQYYKQIWRIESAGKTCSCVPNRFRTKQYFDKQGDCFVHWNVPAPVTFVSVFGGSAPDVPLKHKHESGLTKHCHLGWGHSDHHPGLRYLRLNYNLLKWTAFQKCEGRWWGGGERLWNVRRGRRRAMQQVSRKRRGGREQEEAVMGTRTIRARWMTLGEGGGVQQNESEMTKRWASSQKRGTEKFSFSSKQKLSTTKQYFLLLPQLALNPHLCSEADRLDWS